MDCTRCVEELTAFLDGELPPADLDCILSHLSSCAACSAELKSLQQAVNFIKLHQRELEVNPAIWRQVRARISTPPDSFRLPGLRIARLHPYAIAATAIALTIALGALYYRQTQRKNLEYYMKQYIQSRETNRPMPPALVNKELIPRSESNSSFNPFAEFEAPQPDNPFRVEEP